MSPTRETVLAALAAVAGPDGRTPLPSSGVLSEIIVDAGKVYFSIEVPPADADRLEPMRRAAEAAVKALPGVTGVVAALTAQGPARSARPAPPANAGAHQGHSHGPGGHSHGPAPAQAGARGPNGIPGVRHIVAVASGKGGVGKSTTSANLALALRALGLKVGILDADVFGPSMPRLFGLSGRPELGGDRMIEPFEAYGVKVMSIGFLVEEDTAMIWRGPMVMSAITQLLREVRWGDLDVLVVDMPPGTGDAQLTLAQQVPLSGAVIVSTPQDLALIDARRGIAMFAKVQIPILGIVENMSYFVCSNCGTRHDIFAHGGARHEAERLGVPFLGEVPLAMPIRVQADAGCPTVVSDPNGPHAAVYRSIAEGVMARLGSEGLARPAPRIVIE